MKPKDLLPLGLVALAGYFLLRAFSKPKTDALDQAAALQRAGQPVPEVLKAQIRAEHG